MRIDKIDADLDSETVAKLRDAGIVRLPALIDPDGNKIIGLKKIVELFERNIDKSKQADASPNSPYGGPARNSEFGANPDLNDFYMSELFSGRDPNNGKLIARKDKDEAEDEGVAGDMQRRMAEYGQKAPPHRSAARGGRRTDHDHDDNYDDAPDTRAAPQRNERRNEEYPDDNIADDPPPRRNRDRMGGMQPAQGPPQGEDDMDQRMLAAYLTNNGLED